MEAALEQKPPSPSLLRWVRPPQQARTRETLGRLLDAAEVLFAEKGFEETTIAEIAGRAGSSVGGFYRRFKDKDRLVQALHERFTEESRVTAADVLDPQRWVGSSTAEILAQVAEFLVRVYRERSGLLRTFLHRGVLDVVVQERQEQVFEYIADLLENLLAERTGEIDHPDPALAVRFALRVLFGALDDTIQIRTTVPRLDDDRIVTELGRVMQRYLGVRETSGAPAE
ncbi:MAG: TetR/AcrR family transcriptional regulator [Candidatus Binatia bacterium]